MEGLKIPEESQVRMCKLIDLVGKDEYEWLLPESWQGKLKRENIVAFDHMQWDRADIVVADIWHVGMDKNDVTVKALGTLMEMGWTMERNDNPGRKRKKIFIVITRCPKSYHPFFESKHITEVVPSLEEAAVYLKGKKWKK